MWLEYANCLDMPQPDEPVARRASPAPREMPQIEPPRRFEREPIDIVTVVDDLLLAGR